MSGLGRCRGPGPVPANAGVAAAPSPGHDIMPSLDAGAELQLRRPALKNPVRAGFKMSMRPQAALLVKGGPGDGNTVMLSLGMTMIGRTQPNDIVVDDPGISR